MIKGIDIASIDKNVIDWKTAAKDGVSFAFLRATWGVWPDPLIKSEWDKIKAVNIVRGAYMFLRFPQKPTTDVNLPFLDPEAQAKAFCKAAPLQKGDLPPVIDVEFPGNGIKDTGLTSLQAIDRILIAYRIIRDHYKCEPLIYTSARVWKEDLNNISASELNDCTLWLARYILEDPPEPPIGVGWWFHQYAGDVSGKPGFSSTVDLNRFNPLAKGATGARVKWLQKRLGIKQDGVFGIETENALKAYQAKNGLTPDGVVGPRTFAYVAWEKPAQAENPLNWLQRLIMYIFKS